MKMFSLVRKENTFYEGLVIQKGWDGFFPLTVTTVHMTQM